MQETRVQSLGREDPLEKGMATHSSILAWKSHGQRNLAGYSPWGRKESDTTELLSMHTHTHTHIYKIDNKDLLYSTGNSPQYSVMTYMGKEPKKEWIYV